MLAALGRGGDITYIATEEGWLYLAVVLDLFSRQVVGWSMQPHMQSSRVTEALRMAWFRPSTRGRCHLPLRMLQSILRPRIPVSTGRIQDEKLNEPQGWLLGQRPFGELLGPAESGSVVRQEIRDPPTSN